MGKSYQPAAQNKYWLIPLAVLMFVVVGFALLTTRVAALVGGKIITPAELETRLNIVQFSYDLQFSNAPGYQPDFASQNRRQVLSQLAEEQFLLEAAATLATPQEQEEHANQLLAWLRHNLFQGDLARYEETLAKYHLTEADLITYFSNNLLLTRLREQAIKEVSVSEEEARQFYEEHPERFEHPEMVKVAHILVSDKALAEELLQQLKAGADFAALAKEHSLDKESVAHGGLLPWFSRGQMEAHFEEAAFSLEPGQISSVIETSHGYHIIRAEGKEPAKKQSFSEVAKQASDQALLAKQDAVWSEYRRQLRGRKLILLFSR